MTEKIGEINIQNNANLAVPQEFSKIDECAKSVFEKLDDDKSGKLETAEALKGGLTSLCDKNITINDFINLYLEQASKTTTLRDCIKEFEHQFYDPAEDALVHNIQLSKEQKKDLIGRIELYKAISPYLKENINYNPIYLDKLRDLLKSDKPITNKLLGVILWITNLNKSEQNGYIGPFKQGKVGDCWLLSQINCYASTEDGAKNIKDRIKKNNDNSYTVIFQNPFDLEKQEEYHVMNETINANAEKKVQGEKDVQILEIAFKAYMEKYASEGSRTGDEGFLRGGNVIKYHLLHKALGYKGNVTSFIVKNGSLIEGFYEARKNSDGKVSLLPMYTWRKYSSYDELIKKCNFKPENLTFSIPQNNGAKIPENEKSVLRARHAYNLMDVKNSHFIINNPHLSSFPISLKKERFENLVTCMHYIPLDERVPYSPDKIAENNSDENVVVRHAASAGEFAVDLCKMSAKWLYKTVVNVF